MNNIRDPVNFIFHLENSASIIQQTKFTMAAKTNAICIGSLKFGEYAAMRQTPVVNK